MPNKNKFRLNFACADGDPFKLKSQPLSAVMLSECEKKKKIQTVQHTFGTQKKKKMIWWMCRALNAYKYK